MEVAFPEYRKVNQRMTSSSSVKSEPFTRYEWKRTVALVLVASVCTLLQSLKLILNWRIEGPGIPISFEILKDLVDAAFVFLIPWGGWPAAAIEVAGRIMKANLILRAALSIFSACIIGYISAYRSFENVGASQVLTSIITYIFIFGIVLLVTSVASSLLIKLTRRLQCLLLK